MASIAQELGLSADQLQEGLALLTKSRTVTRRGRTFDMPPRVIVEDKRIFAADLHRAERDIARIIRRLKDKPVTSVVLPAGAFGSITPDASQVAAVEHALTSRAIALTGGPGTGKTTVTRAIIAGWEAARLAVACCAPTGKAAQRMKEQTGREASTIHTLIGLGAGGDKPRHDDGQPIFNRDGEWLRGGPIEANAVVVDETSMVDVRLAAMLLRALPEDCRLLIVGDVDQLPSIGPGRLLFDLIAAGTLPVMRLTQIHRQASESRIPYVARDLKAGQLPDLSVTGTDFTHWETGEVFSDDEDTRLSAVVDRLIRVVTSPEDSITIKKGIPIQDVQVLAAQYKGPCGVVTLNWALQERLNPTQSRDGDVMIGRTYSARLGDRVIHVQNNYELGPVFNGEMGYVAACDPNGLRTVDFDLETLLWSGKMPETEDGEPLVDDDGEPVYGGVVTDDGTLEWKVPRVLVVDFGDRRIAYTRTEARQLELGYCITVHKSQGSQFKAVVLALHCSNPWMLTRPLLYTAITRAEKFCLTIGTAQQMLRASRNTRGMERRTALKERLA